MTKVDILVVGGGMAGLSAALEAAEAGQTVLLVEKEPFLGGRVARMHRFFPKLCPPTCGLELYFRRIKTNPRVQYYTQAQVQALQGQRGSFTATVAVAPRFVLSASCTACGECVSACPVERADDFNYNLGTTKAIYLPHNMAMPLKYVIDGHACRGSECAKCLAACRYGAIDLAMQPETVEVRASSVVMASGWAPYDAARLDDLGFGKYPNVITNVMMERFAAADGPTAGRIIRPGDGREIETIAFLQCAGSRDDNHLPYCSAVCCLASLKQATYVRERYPEAEIYIFFMDIRAPGRYEDFYRKVGGDPRVKLIRGKVSKVQPDQASGGVVVETDDTMSGRKLRTTVDLAVLATGTVPVSGAVSLPGASLAYDRFGFALAGSVPGIHPVGTAKRPMDVASAVRDGTSAALRAIQDVVRS